MTGVDSLGGFPQSSGGSDRRAQLKAAAEAFEAVFLRQMIGSMRQAKLGDELLGGRAGEQFQELADARLADSMAKQQGFGIAEMLLQQFDVRPSAPGESDK